MKKKARQQYELMKRPASVLFIAVLLLLLPVSASGCLLAGPGNVDWATPVSVEDNGNASSEIQQIFDTYASALVTKDKEKFLSTIDQSNAPFMAAQEQKFDRLAKVPYSDYRIKVTGQSEKEDGSITAKVDTSFTFRDSYAALPDANRSALLLVRRDGGWKITMDTTEQTLGKTRNAGLEDFGPVEVLITGKVIVFHLPGEGATAAQVAQLIEAAFPVLQQIIPDANMPKVPVRLFSSKDQIDKAFPGKWTEWTGGAARQMGEAPGQGGEMIIDSQTFNLISGYDPGYNPRMLAHELTHVATFPYSNGATPPFLLEGLADFVAGNNNLTTIRQTLKRGESFSPTLKDLYQPSGFSALLSEEAATLAYEESQAAVSLLIKRYGSDKVLRLIKAFKQLDYTNQDDLVDRAFNEVLGIGWNEFEAQWRDYILQS